MSKKQSESSFIRKIVVATDFSTASKNAFNYAIRLAETFAAEVIAVFVKDADDLAIALRQQMQVRHDEVGKLKKKVDAALRTRFESISPKVKNGINVRFVILQGSPAREVLNLAKKEKADLILSGTRGRSKVSSLVLGSTARELIVNSTCPVLTLNDRQRSPA